MWIGILLLSSLKPLALLTITSSASDTSTAQKLAACEARSASLVFLVFLVFLRGRNTFLDDILDQDANDNAIMASTIEIRTSPTTPPPLITDRYDLLRGASHLHYSHLTCPHAPSCHRHRPTCSQAWSQGTIMSYYILQCHRATPVALSCKFIK